jgi:hypothetical protein
MRSPIARLRGRTPPPASPPAPAGTITDPHDPPPKTARTIADQHDPPPEDDSNRICDSPVYPDERDTADDLLGGTGLNSAIHPGWLASEAGDIGLLSADRLGGAAQR